MSLARDLAHQVGAAQVLLRPADLAAYAWDSFGASGDRALPDAVVFPASTEEVSGVVQVCAHHGVPVVPRGAGTGYAGGATPIRGGVVLNLCRMSAVRGLEPEALRLHAEAGALTATVHRAASAAGLYYPPDPGSSTTCTIGGNVACNAAGPHAMRYGTTADHVAGATAVLADGRVVRLGEGGDGGRQLLALLCGSEGTLGVVTEVLLRLIPAPAARATIAGVFADMERAATAVAEISAARLVPAALEFLDGAALAAVARTGMDAVAPGAGALLLVVWEVRKAISAAVARVMIGKVNEDVVVPRDRIAELVTVARRIGEERDIPVVNFGHLGDGNLHATFLIDPRVPGQRVRADDAAAALFDTVLAMEGSLTGEHGVGHTKLPYMERQLGEGSIALMRRIKQSLDPRDLLNPGKKLPDRTAAEAAA